ncbi:hypothetical protein BDP81DRAFT_194427 [Colletotrichum phormii]|uniref:Uncharacterized protein n=1 Tax=Colletotrichum phormii TaxID=359342 RepID=A0AAI9ZW52_9PEZI|nr:uncharacterized protein BDP81DRAFT_194427 [Colletotrichum phormii]KAK1638976.1 hypothetical protein BDP81DRAFT_194427 [Colletotrichum phormii]
MKSVVLFGRPQLRTLGPSNSSEWRRDIIRSSSGGPKSSVAGPGPGSAAYRRTMDALCTCGLFGPLRRSRADRLGPTSDHVEWCASFLSLPSPLLRTITTRRGGQGKPEVKLQPPWNCLSRNSASSLILEVPSSCHGLMLAQSRMRRFQVRLKCEFVRIRSVGGWETAWHAAESRRDGRRSHAVNGCVPRQVASRAAGLPHGQEQGSVGPDVF